MIIVLIPALNFIMGVVSMIIFQVDDMTCGHCASMITKAVVGVDKMAKVEIDLNNHLVRIYSITADEQEINDAIQEAGYAPIII